MTEIRAFKAYIYNQGKIKDLSSVVCPPYDVISPKQQPFFLNASPYNLIHILLGKDISGENKYKRAKNYFKDWIEKGVLIQDMSPAIYFYSQEYHFKGEKRSRLGFIARLRLEEKKTNIFGHEHTRLEPKEDRLRLLKAVRANLSPIFAIFSDHKRIIQRIYQQYIQSKKPFIDIVDSENIIHRLWRLESLEILADIQETMSQENIFIADGHHRYEVACAYREELRKKLKDLSGEEDFNYILTYFTNTKLSGLTIMPVHRLVKLPAEFNLEKFKLDLDGYFDIEAVKEKSRFLFLLEKAGGFEHVIGMYHNKRFWLLRLKNIKLLDKLISNDKPKEYRSLDVAILNYIILKKILGLDIEDKERIIFSHEAGDLMEQANNLNSAVVFFLNPVKIQELMSVALSGEKMPSKSTYFYPKVLSGLVINKFNV